MIPKHNMLEVSARAMHNPRGAWFTVRPLSNGPMPYPFSMEDEAVPAVVAQFAVEHPQDMNARRVISIATTEYGYAIWCGDKFTQGDITALDASLRVAMAIADLPQDYVEGTRAAMMKLYGAYPLRAPCHFWQAWHKDQGVCKHVAAALQYVERTHPEGLSGLLDELDDMLNSLTTAPLAHLLATRAGTPAAAAAEAADEGIQLGRFGFLFQNRDNPPQRSDDVSPENSLAALQSLADLAIGNPAVKQFFRMGPAPVRATQPDAVVAPAPEAAKPVTRPSLAELAAAADIDLDTLKSFGNIMLTGPMSKHPLFARLIKQALQPGSDALRRPAEPAPAPTAAPNGHAEYASRLAILAQARLQGLVPDMLPAVKASLLELAGKEDARSEFVVWPLMRIVSTNEQLRTQAPLAPNANLLVFADSTNGDAMFALALDADGSLRRPEVYTVNLQTQKVEWYAEDLDIYLRRRASEG